MEDVRTAEQREKDERIKAMYTAQENTALEEIRAQLNKAATKEVWVVGENGRLQGPRVTLALEFKTTRSGEKRFAHLAHLSFNHDFTAGVIVYDHEYNTSPRRYKVTQNVINAKGLMETVNSWLVAFELARERRAADKQRAEVAQAEKDAKLTAAKELRERLADKALGQWAHSGYIFERENDNVLEAHYVCFRVKEAESEPWFVKICIREDESVSLELTPRTTIKDFVVFVDGLKLLGVFQK